MGRKLWTTGSALLLTMSLAAWGGAHLNGGALACDKEPVNDVHAVDASPPDEDASLAHHFDDEYLLHATDHFHLHTNHEPWAQEAGDLLEFTHQRFYELWDGLVEPLDEPLTWIGFTSRDQFNRYALEKDRMDMSWSDGYYSSRTNRVVVVHATSRSQASAGRNYASSSDILGQDGRDDEDRAQPRARIDTGQVTHEAAHHLAFNSGLQTRGVMYPLWVSEGLATNFETNSAGQFGPDVDNENRRRQLLRAWHGGRLMPMDDLVVMTRVPRGGPAGSISETYAQCWAFFQFLYQHRNDELRHYLQMLAAKSTGHRRERVLRNEFYKAFGSFEEIERDYHAFIRDDVARR